MIGQLSKSRRWLARVALVPTNPDAGRSPRSTTSRRDAPTQRASEALTTRRFGDDRTERDSVPAMTDVDRIYFGETDRRYVCGRLRRVVPMERLGDARRWERIETDSGVGRPRHRPARSTRTRNALLVHPVRPRARRRARRSENQRNNPAKGCPCLRNADTQIDRASTGAVARWDSDVDRDGADWLPPPAVGRSSQTSR